MKYYRLGNWKLTWEIIGAFIAVKKRYTRYSPRYLPRVLGFHIFQETYMHKNFKAQKKQANITGMQYFHQIWYFACINSSGFKLVLSFILSSFYFLKKQLPFSPCPAGQDTGAVAAIMIACPFYQVGYRCHRRRQSYIRYDRAGPLPFSSIPQW